VGVAASRLSSRFLHLLGARRTVLLGIGAFVIGAFVLPLTAGSLPLGLAVFAFWAFGTWFGLPGQQTIVASLNENLRGTMLAFNSSALNLGGVWGPIATGQVLTAYGFRVAGPWASFIGLIALILAWFLLPRTLPEREDAGLPIPAGD
jgi:predicted MFS family arabinose efflux permease